MAIYIQPIEGMECCNCRHRFSVRNINWWKGWWKSNTTYDCPSCKTQLVLPQALRWSGFLVYGAILAGLIYLFESYELPDWLVITGLLVYLFTFTMSNGIKDGYVVIRKIEK